MLVRLRPCVVGFEQRIHDLVQGVPELADIMEPLLAARRVLREKFAKLHGKVLLLARDNEVCQRLMTICPCRKLNPNILMV
jgi:transposase